MHIEVCLNCKYLQFFRPTDVNPSSSKSSHRTGRQCSNCRNVLYDTIVQRGEEGFLPFPNNWRGVFEKLDECDLVICAGTSFEILGCYKKLFPAGLKIVVINIAPTKKDKDAVLVIREECDKVFVKLAAAFNLDIRHYCRSCDPVLNFRTSRRAYFMSNYTFCQCHIRVPRISSTRAAAIEDSVPGFMMGGLPGWINGQPELLEDDEDELSECESVELKRKRKRGRPRKNSTARISTKTTVKKSVGRPRKKVAKVEHEEAKPPCTPSHAESRAVEGDLSTFDLGEIANCLNDLISSVCAD
ncbi:hypothetical protein L596_003546 [Steinernema carpocapsae]|uniref:Deacetylase sirtuin-type domain-containing protein n=1 Tax=Steinernema carpocapsae TaxID=34508 RepID=A0A4V6I822_STECR|nr:hypothetical protein L596_003546 [Steinernema carpocapsae]